MRVDKDARSEGIIRISLIFYNMKVYCVFSLESPHWGDSIEYTQYTIFNTDKKITLNYPNLKLRDFFLGTQVRVRNSRGERAISVRAVGVLLYLDPLAPRTTPMKTKSRLVWVGILSSMKKYVTLVSTLFSRRLQLNPVIPKAEGVYTYIGKSDLRPPIVRWQTPSRVWSIQYGWKYGSYVHLRLCLQPQLLRDHYKHKKCNFNLKALPKNAADDTLNILLLFRKKIMFDVSSESSA